MPRNGTRKSDLRRRRERGGDGGPGRIRRSLYALVRSPTRAALVGLALSWFLTWLLMGGALERTAGTIGNAALTKSAHSGFSIRNLLVEGRENIDAATLKTAIGLSWGDPVFGFDTDEVRKRIEALPWVRHARVERRLPDTVFIRVEERKPLALWQSEGALSLIDPDGNVLSDRNLERFQALPLVVGQGAPEHAKDILDMIEAEPTLRNRVAASIRVGKRRWDIKLTNGIMIRLPEQDPGLALRRVAESQMKDGILEKNLAAIDLREKDRMILRTPTPSPSEIETAAGTPIPKNTP